MIVGNSIGTGIIAVPYLATKNSMLDVVWMVALAYIVNVILHLIISELSYNNGGLRGSPSSPLTTWMTAWLAEVANTTMRGPPGRDLLAAGPADYVLVQYIGSARRGP